MLTGILLLSVLLLVGAAFCACFAGMFCMMAKSERRLNAAALWAMTQIQEGRHE